MNLDFHFRGACALCQAPLPYLRRLMELPSTPLANEFTAWDQEKLNDLFPLSLVQCEKCAHIQLGHIVNSERLFRKYVYVSGTSKSFVQHFRDFAKDMIVDFGISSESKVMDIGSNDGTLLKQFQELAGCPVLGIDPARAIAAQASQEGVPTVSEFFTQKLAMGIAKKDKFDLVCANNVFAHAGNLRDFALGVKELLSEHGVFVFEVSYFYDVVNSLLFDTIYHEHTSYHTLLPLISFFHEIGMEVFDAKYVGSHGGSLRCYVSLKGSRWQKTERFKEAVFREVTNPIDDETISSFKERIETRMRMLRSYLATISQNGPIAGFGAPAKLTTLMYTAGLDSKDVSFIVDDSPLKQGLSTPGTGIPVLNPQRLLDTPSNACIIFAWNFADQIIKSPLGQQYLKSGRHFIIPLPEFRIER